MVNFAREVYVCVCPTSVEKGPAGATNQGNRLTFRMGNEDDLSRLDPKDHAPEYLERCRQRFQNHWWLVGELDSKIVTYTWLHQKSTARYRFLEGCNIKLSKTCGYGFDAWTPPQLRGQGLRRKAFVEELRFLKEQGLSYEASFFVKHQLDGATRSLAKAGIAVLPVWRLKVKRDKTYEVECVDDKLSHIVQPDVAHA